MDLVDVTFAGPPFGEGSPIVAALPDELVALLRQVNGFILREGALHVRGVCDEPPWHSLAAAMTGPRALHRLYPSLRASDVPFAQDCVADQFVLRDGVVHRLESETGTLEALDLSLAAFFAQAEADPVEFLGMQPLQRHRQEGGALQPGQVLHVYPPFCTREAANGVSLRAVPVGDALAFLADFARHVSGLSPDQPRQVEVEP